jgi:hypothetical protein
MKYNFRLLALAVTTCSLLTDNSASAQGTAFTYQGRLEDGSNGANGKYDMRFKLYGDPAGTTQIGASFLTNALPVTNGLFLTMIDFGGGIFNGSNYWLEVDVKTNGAGSYAVLTPLQSVTPAPYAVFANTASNLSGTLPTAQLSGTIASGNLPASPTFSGTVSGSSFSGSGASLTTLNANNLSSGTVPLARLSGLTSNQLDAATWQLATNLNGGNAASLGGLSSSNFWQPGGNNVAAGQFIGSTNNQPLELWVNDQRGMRLEPTTTDVHHSNIVNVVNGSAANLVVPGVYGATISGGGAGYFYGEQLTNSVTQDFGAVGGGAGNTRANYGTVGGGDQNSSTNYGTVGGGTFNASGKYATVGGGYGNISSGAGAFIGGGGANENFGGGNLASGAASVISGGFYN